MTSQDAINYQRIARAIEYIGQHHLAQPNLEEVARQVHLSPYHFQRLFTQWAGVSPKKFLQYLNLAHAKQLLCDKQATLFDAACQTGLSGTGRLHDLFISIEGMTPGEFKNGGQQLDINYQFATAPFGQVLVASTHKGICHLAFVEDEEAALNELYQHFPKASFNQKADPIQQNALRIFTQDWSQMEQVKLHLRGTPFQLKVWEALLKIPLGQLSTYGQMTTSIEKPGASRAVGSAIGKNPVGYLIPCHRVIRSSGAIGDYRWGSTRKLAMIGWEAARKGKMEVK